MSDGPSGGKILRFVCPNGMTVTLPLDANGVELVVTRLRGTGLEVARAGSVPGI